MNVANLHSRLSAVAPIIGISIGSVDDKSTWRVDFDEGATAQQRADAAGVIEAFDVNAGQPRMALGSDLFSVLSRDQHTKLSAARADDLRIITARGQDLIPESNSKLARLAAAMGITVASWFALLS
jgi:hypothetical protein